MLLDSPDSTAHKTYLFNINTSHTSAIMAPKLGHYSIYRYPSPWQDQAICKHSIDHKVRLDVLQLFSPFNAAEYVFTDPMVVINFE